MAKQIENFARESDIDFVALDEGNRDHALHYTVPDRQTQVALMSIAKKLDLLIP